MARIVLSSYLSVCSEKLNACLFSQLPIYFSNKITHKNFLSHIAKFTFAKAKAKAKACKHSMFVNSRQTTYNIKDGVLRINGKDVLTMVPDNIILTPWSTEKEDNNDSSPPAFFIGAKSTHQSSRHVFKLGVIQDMRFMCLFRYKMWWMIPRVGNSASDIPIETQLLMLEVKEEIADEIGEELVSYIALLPVLDGNFRSSLQGNSANEVELCVESGDPAIVASESLKAIFVNYGNNPFDLMANSMKILEKCMGTFSVRESKQMPGILDCFGWCTWDAFYHDVNPQGIKDGLASLAEGGTPAKFLIIDDGWQDTTNEFRKEGEPIVEGSQFGARLVSIEENTKFCKTAEGDQSNELSGLKEFVSDIKRNFGLKYVYVWHALMGYWGGLNPDSPRTKKYNPKLTYLLQSPGNLANMRDVSLDCMGKYGVSTIDPAKITEFYNDLHMYLSSQEVDGVKVDVQNILETVAAGSGGRVALTRHFQLALEKSISANFRDNSIICCMGLSTDTIYNTKRSAITRASDDYYPENPKTQTLHIAAVAYNSILLGEVFVPDWDMFCSKHDAAEFHAVARAVGGCGVYVSDKPGEHDFGVLKRLVLPNGSILRAKYPGRPTRDCLFVDPVMDGKSLLKIWNMNNFSGVIGVFNCQGSGSWPCLNEEMIQKEDVNVTLSCQVSPSTDIDNFDEVCGDLWTGDCAVYSFIKGTLTRLSKKQSIGITLKTSECDVFTVSHIKVYSEKIQLAPLGLIDMYNSGGAIDAIETLDDTSSKLRIKGRGVGRFGAYSSRMPKFCIVNSKEVPFDFRTEDFLLTMRVPDGLHDYWEITIGY